mgnify:CR=1 FL=1
MNESIIKGAVEAMLSQIPHNGVEGTLETPDRVARMWKEFEARSDFNLTTFPANGTDEMIVCSEIMFYSFCEHHLLPFFGTAVVAYIPDPSGKICGLSKLARVVDKFSLRPQTQEYLTNQIADYLYNQLAPLGAGVVLQAEHLCMSMRGVQRTGAQTTTSALRGCMKEDAACRSEFLHIAF